MALREWPLRYTLRTWQTDFVDKYLEQRQPRSLLVAAPGTGKPLTALFAAHRMMEHNFSSSLIVLNDVAILRDQWKQIAGEVGFNLSNTIDQYRVSEHDGVSITVQSLNSNDRMQQLLDLGTNTRCFGIIDESHRPNKNIDALVDNLLRVNTENNFLFIAGTAPSSTRPFPAQFQFNTEYIFQQSVIRQPETKIDIIRFSPSFSILSRLRGKHIQIDDLNWREFEKLISELLEGDGYDVELMRGTKDGGVDVVAVKDMGEAGSFKTLWQAKKKAIRNRVGLSVIRELADTTNEFKASKGVIVTSTYLTRDALARIQRDKYILSKVDRDDLDGWIQRHLFGDARTQ